MVDLKETQIMYEAFCAIAESYTSIVYADMSDEKVYPIRLDEYAMRYKDDLEAGIDMKTALGKYVRETVFRDDADNLMRFADYDFVKNRLEKENPVFFVYRCVHNDVITYYRLKIVPIEEGRKLIFGFENFDKQFRTQLKLRSERDMQMTILDGLSREYMSVWYLDGKSRKVTLIRNNGAPADNAEPVRIGETMVDYHFSMLKYFTAFAAPEDFDDLMQATSYDTLVKNAGLNDLYRVNYTRINTNGTTSRFQVCFAKIDDDAGINDFLLGFRSID